MANEPIESDKAQGGDSKVGDYRPPAIRGTSAQEHDPEKEKHHTQNRIYRPLEWLRRRRQDLWRLGTSAGMWMAIATIVIAIATVVNIGVSKQQWQAMREQLVEMEKTARAAVQQAETSAKQLELSERPWVSASSISLNHPVRFTEKGGAVRLHFVLQNTGRSPATGVRVTVMQMPAGMHPSDLNPGYACGWARLRVQADGNSLFPGNTLSTDQIVGIGGEIMGDGENIEPRTLSACIAYQPIFDETTIYETGYIIELWRIHKPPLITRAFRIGETVDPKALELRVSSPSFSAVK